jgi:spore maturation protein CgeB
MKQKKILTAFLRYDYGIKEKGESGEKLCMLPALEALGYNVTAFWLEDNGFPDRIDELQKRLLRFAEAEKPDAIFFILMKDEININTLEELSKKYITINWFCDDQWRFESYTKHIAPHLTYSVTVDKHSLRKYAEIGVKNVILSQWAASQISDQNIQKVSYVYDISFVGGKNWTREWMVDELKKAGFQVECFGAGWPNGKVPLERMGEIFLKSKINLNLSNSESTDYRYHRFRFRKKTAGLFKFNIFEPIKSLKNYLRNIKSFIQPDTIKNVEQIKARNFEIPGFGGFELTQYALGLEDYYNIGKEIAVFSNPDELKKQVAYYLNNPKEREEMKRRGVKRTQEYNYKNRLSDVFREVLK